jgi:hypothetical protein
MIGAISYKISVVSQDAHIQDVITVWQEGVKWYNHSTTQGAYGRQTPVLHHCNITVIQM